MRIKPTYSASRVCLVLSTPGFISLFLPGYSPEVMAEVSVLTA